MRLRALLLAPSFLMTALAGAQSNLGAYYGSLYFATHVTVGLGGHGRRHAHRAHSRPGFDPQAPRSATIERMASRVPAASRSVVEGQLYGLRSGFPQVVRTAARQVGVALRPNDLRDVATLASMAAFQELRGLTLTNAQFRDQLRTLYGTFAKDDAPASQIQQRGDFFEMSILLMVFLKGYEHNPTNKNPALTRQQLRGLAGRTFHAVFGAIDPAKVRVTPKGLEAPGR